MSEYQKQYSKRRKARALKTCRQCGQEKPHAGYPRYSLRCAECAENPTRLQDRDVEIITPEEEARIAAGLAELAMDDLRAKLLTRERNR